jgi:sugar (pentulose or hexulose) kinase
MCTFDTDAMSRVTPTTPPATATHSGDSIGTLKGRRRGPGAQKTSLVAPGSGDNMTLGAGAVRDRDLVISLGTSGTMFGPYASC